MQLSDFTMGSPKNPVPELSPPSESSLCLKPNFTPVLSDVLCIMFQVIVVGGEGLQDNVPLPTALHIPIKKKCLHE